MRCSVVVACLAATLFIVNGSPVPAQERPVASAERSCAGSGRPNTLGALICGSGFPVPIDFPLSDLDRELTSSEAAHDETQFVVGAYFADELEMGQVLGPLRLIRITKAGQLHQLRLPPDGGSVERGGSILRVSFSPGYTFVETHRNPSAGYVLVLDSSFALVSSLYGFFPEELADGAILYKGSMIHFAPFHRETFKVFDPRSGQTTELLPGPQSRFEQLVTQGVRDTLARVAPTKRDELAVHMVGAGVDVSILRHRIRPDGRAVAAVVSYGALRLLYADPNRELVGDRRVPKDRSWPRYDFTAVAICMKAAGDWSCSEQELDAVAKAHNIAVPDDDDAKWAAFERVLARVLP